MSQNFLWWVQTTENKIIKEAKKKIPPLKLSGKIQPFLLKHLTKNNTEVTNKKDIVDILAETFSTNFSLKNANWQFQIYKHNAEKNSLNFKSDNF